MDADDLAPPPAPAAGFTPRPLDPLSVAELERYIGQLEDEIARARAAIGAKQAVRAGAEALFRR